VATVSMCRIDEGDHAVELVGHVERRSVPAAFDFQHLQQARRTRALGSWCLMHEPAPKEAQRTIRLFCLAACATSKYGYAVPRRNRKLAMTNSRFIVRLWVRTGLPALLIRCSAATGSWP
jgi:hypothetical protein